MRAEMIHPGPGEWIIADAARCSFDKRHDQFTPEQNEKLIRFLARAGHWLPFRHPHLTVRCEAPIFVARQLVKHQVGFCLTGDTRISFVKVTSGVSNGIREVCLADLYRMWSGQIKYQGGEKGKRNVRISHIRVFNENTLRFERSHISEVIYCGKKDVYELTTTDGLAVTTSADHDFLTQEGWKKLKDIEVGDFVISDRAGESFAHSIPGPRGFDRFIRRKFYDASEKICTVCGTSEDTEVDHITPVWQAPERAKDWDNLQVLCRKHHYEKSALERPKVTNLLPKYSEVSDISYCGQEETYDLSIDRVHNFLANGIVVHNSWSEASRRYLDSEPGVFYPQSWRRRAPDKKQGSLDEEVEHGNHVRRVYRESVTAALAAYRKLLDEGVAPEQARMVLPVAMMTTWTWTGSLLAFSNTVRMRKRDHTQAETMAMVCLIEEVVRPHYPLAWQVLQESEAY